MPTEITEEYDFVPCTQDDFKELVDFTLEVYMKIENHNSALGMTAADIQHLFEYVVAKALHYPYNLKVVEKATGKMVGMRTMTICHRDSSLDFEPFPYQPELLSPKARFLDGIVADVKKTLWDKIDPTITKMLHYEVSAVHRDHQRKGIAKYMAELGIDYDNLRREGIQGIGTEVMGIANLNNRMNFGYKVYYEHTTKGVYDYADKITDGTTGITALFKDIRIQE